MKHFLMIPLLASASPLFGAVNLPYTNSFSSPAADFTAGGTGTWNVGSGNYSNSIPTDGPSFSVTQVTGLGGTTKQSFSMSTVITSASGSTGTAGFALLATGSNLNTSSFILADLFNGGNLRFRPFVAGAATGSDVLLATNIRLFEIGTLGAINLSVTGIYNPDDSLTLTLTASQGANTSSSSTTYASAALPTGDWFGYRDRNNTGATNITPFNASFGEITINAVPEPSVALLSAGFIGLAARRRR